MIGGSQLSDTKSDFIDTSDKQLFEILLPTCTNLVITDDHRLRQARVDQVNLNDAEIFSLSLRAYRRISIILSGSRYLSLKAHFTWKLV